MKDLKIDYNNISVFVFDVDGVFTDGSLILLPGGAQARTMNVKDGYAIKAAISQGYEIVIISAGVNDEVINRLALLGVPQSQIFMGKGNKIETLHQFLESKNLKLANCVYMGDDIPDMDCMQEVAISACPNDAAEEVKSIANYRSPIDGGKGCVRDWIQTIMRAQGKWNCDTKVMSR